MTLPYTHQQLIDEARRRWGAFPFRSLEDIIASPRGFGIATMTALQRAICRVIDGKPLGELATHPHVIDAFGNVAALVDDNGVPIRPKAITLLAGIRTFKSLLVAAASIKASQECDLSLVGKADPAPRFPIVSVRKDLARAIYSHVLGVLSQPSLRHLMTREPSAEMIWLRHPSGREVEIRVSAASRAGSSNVARWLFGIGYDEAARMVGASEGVVNLDDERRAVAGRLLPGAQQFEISSPWAPFGPVYETVSEHEGRPTPDLVVIRAPADRLNPIWWTPERIAHIKRTNPVAYQTDVLAQFADLEESLFPIDLIESCLRKDAEPIPHQPGHDYAAAMDPATRRNSWPLVIADRVGSMRRVVWADEWQGTPAQPQSPRKVLGEASATLGRYGLDWAMSDQFAADALVDIADEFGLSLVIHPWDAKGKLQAFMALRAAMLEGNVSLPRSPALIKDLRMVKRRVTQTGSAIVLPQTAHGRHCDFAPALAMVVHQWIDDTQEVEPEPGTPEHARWVEDQYERRDVEAWEDRQQQNEEMADWVGYDDSDVPLW